MPCRDYYDDHPEAYYGPQLANKDAEIVKLKKQISFAESALCAVLRASDKQDDDNFTEGHVWHYIDFKGAGITADELIQWQAHHYELDRKHRAEEARRNAAAAEKQKREEEADAMVAQLKASLPPEIVSILKKKL